MYVTRRIPKPGPEFLKKNDCTLTFWDSDEAIPHADLVKNMQADKYDALLCMLTDQVDAAVMDAAGELFLLTTVFCSPKHWSENWCRSSISAVNIILRLHEFECFYSESLSLLHAV